MMTLARHPRRGFAESPSRFFRTRLLMEQLEDRSLLSAPGLVDLSSFRLDPSGAYDPGLILVQFQPGRAAPDVQAILPGSRLGQSFDLVPGLREVVLPAGVSVPGAVAAFQASPSVVFAEPNYQGQVDYIPNDPRWSSLYGMQRINAPGAWDFWTGWTSPVIAVLDTGVYYDHEDLYLNIWVNQGEIPADRYYSFTDVDYDGLITFWDLNDPINQGDGLIVDVNFDGKISGSDILAPAASGGWADGVDADGNGRVDDLVGWDFQSNNRMPLDSFGHGTHVAGTIGAVGDNFLGVVGVNMRAQIMVLRVGPGPSINLSAAINGLNYAVTMGALVSNNSWGGTGTMLAMRTAIARARDFNHIVVAAAGNDNRSIDVTRYYPASYSTELDNVLTVAASTTTDSRASFSNYGVNTVQLAAPGLNILSTLRSGGYGNMSGTSMAAPHVAGAVAFLFSAYPGIDYQTVMYSVLAGVDYVPSLAPFVGTSGRLNLFNSLAILWGWVGPGGSPGGGRPADGPSGFTIEPGTPGSFLAVGEEQANVALVVRALAESAPAAPAVVSSQQPIADDVPQAPAVELSANLAAAAETPRADESRAARVEAERDLLFAELFGAL